MVRDIQAIALLTGTVMGVGLFSLPYLLHHAGIIPMFVLFVLLGALLLFLQLSIGHLVAVSDGEHLIPGYITKYLGPVGRFVSFFAILLSLLFALIAYLIAGGIFLSDLFRGGLDLSPAWWAAGIFVLGGYFIFRGARTVARVELLFLVFFILLFLTVLLFGIPAFDAEKLPYNVGENPFLAFGGILFALWGIEVIPELRRILGPNERRIRRVILISGLISFVLTILFTFLIAGISGSATTPDGLTGLKTIIDEKVLALLFIFGFIAVFTSYMSLGVTLRDAMHYDFRLPWAPSFLIAAILPFALYLAGITSLIQIISIVGILFLATQGILLSATLFRFAAVEKQRMWRLRQFIYIVMVLALIAGAGLALQDFFASNI